MLFRSRLGELLGSIMFCLLRRERQIALANCAVAFGDSRTPKERKWICRRSFENVFGTIASLIWAPRFSETDIRLYVDNGAEFTRINEFRGGRGIIMLTLHYGDWELMGQAAPAFGLPLTIVARSLPNVRLGEKITALRSQTGNSIIPQHGAVRRLFQELRRGGAVALLADLNARRDTGGVWLDFFGLPVFNNSSVAALSLRTGAPIWLMVAEPIPGGRVRLRSGNPIEYISTGDYENDVKQLSQLCLSAGEALIREKPELWLWSYRRWRHRPQEDQGRYPFYSSHLAT